MTERLTELNNAIYTVITTQYKKEAKEAHELVTAYGFGIWKQDGHFHVCNKETHKSVYVSYEGWKERKIYLDGLLGEWVTVGYDQECKVDFVSFLTKPKNMEYYQAMHRDYNYSSAVEKSKNLAHLKYMSKSYSEDIEDAREKIDKLLKDIEHFTEMKVMYEQDLAKARVEYGLV